MIKIFLNWWYFSKTYLINFGNRYLLQNLNTFGIHFGLFLKVEILNCSLRLITGNLFYISFLLFPNNNYYDEFLLFCKIHIFLTHLSNLSTSIYPHLWLRIVCLSARVLTSVYVLGFPWKFSMLFSFNLAQTVL